MKLFALWVTAALFLLTLVSSSAPVCAQSTSAKASAGKSSGVSNPSGNGRATMTGPT
jgi:hypothetical protein